MEKEKSFTLFNLPPLFFAVFSAVILLSTYLGVLPEGMAGCFAFMIVVGTILYEIGERTPPIRAYLGGGAIVVLFGVALLNYFNLLPSAVKLADGSTSYNMAAHLDLVGNIRKFFRPTGAFLDFYIAALITGSILGMNRKLLVKAAARYFPAIIGAVFASFALTTLIGTLMGFGSAKSMLLIALPIMGGGMGAGGCSAVKNF